MYSPVLAMTWELWRRNRWTNAAFGLLILGYVIAVAAVPIADPEKFATLGSIWFGIGLCFLVVVVAHGAEVRLEAADSAFPSRAFTLPVRTSLLVGWPMFAGTAAVVVAFTIWDAFVLRPCGIETPFWWKPMLGAIVICTQAILWMPFGVPWLRLPVAIAALTVLVKAPMFLSLLDSEKLFEPEEENRILSLVALGLMPVGFAIARAGVARARRGDGLTFFTRTPRQPGGVWRERRQFSSPMSAQVWYEWRLRGLGLPIITGLTISFLMLCGFLLASRGSQQVGFGVTFLLVPFMIAAFRSSYQGGMGERLRSFFELPVFTATLPLRNSKLVAAKLVAAALSATATWLLAILLTALWMTYADGLVAGYLKWQVVRESGAVRASALAVTAVVGPILVLWRILVGDLWIGLSGRVWISHAMSILLGVFVLQAMYEVTMWQADPTRKERFLDVLPWVAGVAVVVKFLTAGWFAKVLVDRGELARSSVIRIAIGWLLAAVTLFALLVWLAPADFAPTYGLALGAILFLPLARLAAAPLALGWNRHR